MLNIFWSTMVFKKNYYLSCVTYIAAAAAVNAVALLWPRAHFSNLFSDIPKKSLKPLI